jgi:hypothetical protein
VPFDEAADGVPAERTAARSGEDRVAGLSAAFGEVVLDHRDGRLGERGGAFLSAFSGAVHEGAGAEVDVGDAERGELAGAQSGLQCQDEQRVVAAAQAA